MLLVAALAAVMVVLRVKALLALANLACYITVVKLCFLDVMGPPFNPFPLAAFFSQLVCDPLLDVYFSGLSVTERWKPFLAAQVVDSGGSVH